MKNFKTYNLARELFRAVDQIRWPSAEFKNQAHRASLSVVLNLAEGFGKRTTTDRRRFYQIAMGSLRETQACLDLFGTKEASDKADQVGASLYKLIQNPGQFPA